LVNRRFGKLLVVKKVERPPGVKHRNAMWLCQCACGGTKVAMSQHLLSGATQSCGCLRESKSLLKHPLYKMWREMVRRCHDKGHPEYPQFGGRGIRVCDSWRVSFREFLQDVGTPPNVDMTLERSADTANFSKGTTRWYAKVSGDGFYSQSPDGYINHHTNMARFRRETEVPLKSVPPGGRVKDFQGWLFWR